VEGEAPVTIKEAHQDSRASLARREGLGAAWGLVNGLIFALGLWIALIGLFVLLLR
jgi:hypothetical protein